jgi:hypothetical protein
LIIQTIVLLIGEDEVVILNIEQRCCVAGTEDRTTTLACELASEGIVLYTLDYQEHIAFDTLFLLKSHIGPTQGVDILLNALFEGVENLLVGTLYLIRIDADSTSELLSP